MLVWTNYLESLRCKILYTNESEMKNFIYLGMRKFD